MCAGLPGPRREFGHWSEPAVRLAHATDAAPAAATAAGEVPAPAGQAASDPELLLALVGDIRLDDRTDLQRRLGLDPSQPIGDPDLVLAAYRRWGDLCVEHLVGDFAFALWDGRRRQVMCARDPFGTRPFYFHLAPATFAFSSGPEALLRLPVVPCRLNPLAAVDYLYHRYEDTEASPWLDVLRLPPGSSLVVGTDQVRRRRFWHPESIAELRLGSDAEYEEAFRVALGDAVGARLAATGVGIYLSGGLDSSSVACVARPLYRGGRLATFSAGFDLDPGSDERAFAAAVAAHIGADAHVVRPEDTSPLADWAGAPWTGPAPGCSPQVAVVRSVTESAVEHGVSVLLSGIGGDSVVSHGPAYLTELAASGHPGRFLVEARALARRHHRPLGHVVQKYGLRPFVPTAMIRARRALHGKDFAIAGVRAPVRIEVIEAMGLEGRAADLGLTDHLPRTARLAHLAELTAGLPPYALELSHHVDAVTGVERRYPVLDRRLAELCLSLPGDQKLRDGWTRSIMRRALAGVVPEVVRLRPGKSDLSDPLVRGLLGPDRPVFDALVARPGPVSDWIDPTALTTLWHRCLAERRAADCFILWRVAVLSRWLTHHGLA